MATSPSVRDGGAPNWTIPDWLSPARTNCLSEQVWFSYTLPAGEWFQIAKPSAKRAGLIVIVDGSDPLPTLVTPFPGQTTIGVRLQGNTNLFTATLYDWFIVLGNAWKAFSSGGSVVNVCDVMRR